MFYCYCYVDVFERFIHVCLEYYGLDPCHYFSSLGLAWNAMLKITGVELELISDIDMYLFIEKGMRGGISYIAKRYCKANNKYVEGYDTSRDNSFIMYFDANNLYGWAMTQYLPHGCFKWMNRREIDDFDFNLVSCDSCKEYILQVDLEYPDILHDFHERYGIKVGDFSKLIPNLRGKERYVVHYRNL